MPAPTLVNEITQLVDDAIATADPVLYEQLLRALQLLLAEHSEAAPER